MTTEKTSDLLVDYFTELLTDTDDLEPRLEIPIVSQNKLQKNRIEKQLKKRERSQHDEDPLSPQKLPHKHVHRPLPQLEIAALEEAKRQQLQTLLSRPLTTPLKKVEPKPEPLVEVEPVQAIPKPILKQKIPAALAARTDADEQALLRQKLGAPEPVSTSEIDMATQFQHSINATLAWTENGRPQWAQKRFDVLLFAVSGLTLAVPLIALGQIQTIDDDLTPIFGQSDWFMGLLNTPHGQIRTVNTALFVMPEKYNHRFVETAKYVISIDGLPWGLAVDSVNQPISLDPADVKWRTQRTSRPWLAGTVKSAMCALIDIPKMGAMLRESEPNKP